MSYAVAGRPFGRGPRWSVNWPEKALLAASYPHKRNRTEKGDITREIRLWGHYPAPAAGGIGRRARDGTACGGRLCRAAPHRRGLDGPGTAGPHTPAHGPRRGGVSEPRRTARPQLAEPRPL